MQQKLDTYFKIIPKYDQKSKKCFIYDPSNCKAFFTTTPEPTDKFIVTKSYIKLFYRTPLKVPDIPDIPDIPIIKCKYDVPLIKSNLQKAIRRCDSQIAVQSTIALIQQCPMELLRRLPVICIEDVTLMDSFPILIWLMMADKDYGSLSKIDINIILNIVISLCECKKYFPYEKNELNYAFTHETLQFCPNSNELLSLPIWRTKRGYANVKSRYRLL